MTDTTNKTITAIGREVEKAKQVGALLEQMGETDTETLLLSLESETDLPEMVCRLYDAILEHEVYLGGLEAKLAELGERKERIKKSIETLKGVVFLAMERANLSQVKHPCATLSTRNTPPQTIIEDEMQIPLDYWKRPDPVLDKTKIKDALKAGVVIPGCVLSNGGRALSIRVK